MKKLTIMVGLAMLLALAVPYGAEAQPVIEVTKLTASDAEDSDRFGRSVAVSGDTAVVGAYYEDGAGTRRGAAYVFERDQGGPGNWGEVKKLTASDAEDYDRFGWSVAVSGDTAVVGADREAGAGSMRGAAYVFERDQGGAGNWGEVAKLTASDAEDSDYFGNSAAVGGDTAVVGAHFEDGAGSERGAAYVFERDQGGAGNWGEVAKLTALDAEDLDYFGMSAAVGGDFAVVGAYLEDGAGINRGAAYVFGRDQGGPGNWGQVKKLTALDAENSDFFGYSVALSGDTAVVGARYENGAGGNNRGAAYVFERDQGGPGNWGQVTKLTASDAEDLDYFGISVAVSGNTAVVGAYSEDGAGSDRGAAYVFGRDEGGAGNWGQVKKLTASDAEDDDWFGISVAVGGDSAVVGAHGEDAGGARAGAAYVFGPPLPTPTPTITPTATVTPTPTPSPVIDLLAGTSGVFDFGGDGGPAQNALLNDPRGSFEVIDSNTLYFADTGNSRIRRVSPNEPTGTITTVAGGGTPTPGFCGDGGLATEACLDHPYDVFADEPGNLYIADTDNNRIRVVNTQGQSIQVAGVTIDAGEIETVAGTGEADYYGDDGPATSAKLNGPRGVAVDESGNIFIADTENHRIRKVDTGGTITTVAGNGTPGFGGDGGAAIAASLNRPHDVYVYGELGDFVIADTVNNRIRRVDGFMGVIDAFAGSGQAGYGGDGGLATLADLNSPEAVAVDSAHSRLPNVFIADTQNHRIRRVDGRSTIITTVAGDGTAGSGGDGGDPTAAQLNLPSGIAVGSLTGSDTGNSTLRAIDPSTGKPSGRFSGFACTVGSVSTADWVLVTFVVGFILARRRIRGLTMQIRVLARLAARPGATG